MSADGDKGINDGDKGNKQAGLEASKPRIVSYESFKKLSHFFGAPPPIPSPPRHLFKPLSRSSTFFTETESDDDHSKSGTIKSGSAAANPTSPTHERRWKSETKPVDIQKSNCPTSATFDEIIDFFTDPHQLFLDEELDALILWLPSFAKPFNLLYKLRTHFDMKADLADSKALLELRLRQDNVLDFLNAWLRSVSGMEDLRCCPNLQEAVRKFLEQGQDATDAHAPKLQSMIQLLNLVITHANRGLDMAQDLFVQSKVRERAASCAKSIQMKKMSRRSVSATSVPPLSACSPSDKSGSRKQLLRVRSWKLRYYKHRSPASSPTRSRSRKTVHSLPSRSASSYFNADGRIHSLMLTSPLLLSPPQSNELHLKHDSTDGSSTDVLDSDDGLAHGSEVDMLGQERLGKDPLLCMIERQGGKKTTRQILATKLAHSLTSQDITMLGSIHPRELVNKRWTTAQKGKMAPNVLNATHLFNRRVMWVTSTILSVKPSKVQIALKFFLALADELLQLHNFNGFAQVIHGLKSPWLRRGRWKNAFDKLRLKHVNKWKRYCDIFESNNHGYRQLVRSWLASGKSKRQIPCLYIFLSDIYRVDAKMPWFVGGTKRINISKALQLSKLVHSHLGHGTNGAYTDIEADLNFDQMVEDSLDAILTQGTMGRIVQNKTEASSPDVTPV